MVITARVALCLIPLAPACTLAEGPVPVPSEPEAANARLDNGFAVKASGKFEAENAVP